MTSTLDLTAYDGKKVIVTVNQGDSAEEIEGTVETGNALGLLIKPKGKASVEIIEAGQIEQVVLAPEKLKNIVQKYVKVLELGKARQHLADYHAATLTEVNSMTEESAFSAHQAIDHSDLGHIHGEKPKKEKAADETAGDPTEAGNEPEAVASE